jgi:hypothetical protein
MVAVLSIGGRVRAATVICLALLGVNAASAQVSSGTGARAARSVSAADKADMAAVAKALGKSPYGELDLAEPLHQRYFMRQLELGGFTRAEYPMMFATIDAAQKTAIAHRARLGAPKSTASGGIAAAPPRSMRLLAPASTGDLPIVPIVNVIAVGQDPFSQAISATVQLSIPNNGNTAPSVAMTTLGLYDQNGNQIGGVNGVSENFAGFDLRNTVIGVPTTTPTQITVQGSYYYIDVYGAPHSGAIYAQAAQFAGLNQTITNTSPTDIDGNRVIKVCVVRQDADCDYMYSATGGQYIVQFPIQGSITFPVALQPIAQQQANGAYSITITQPNPTQGGGCSLPANFNFWNNATVNGSVLSWNINPGPFSNPVASPNNPCFPSNSTVVYNLFVTVLGIDSKPYLATITTAQLAPPPPNTLVIYPMSVAYGCVEEGSRVSLPGGGSIPIEKLVPGQQIVAAGGRTLEVSRLTRGDEALPMVRIKTRNGRSLLLTETHPVLTLEGPVMAKSLVAGQVAMTEQGPSELVSIGREPGGKVWNIAFAATSATASDEGFFANGVLVGDAAAQQRAELRERNMLAQRQQTIPAAWRTDAESAQRHARLRAAGL